MSEKNCKELGKQPDIDGFLVGGASLKPACKWIPDHQLTRVLADFSKQSSTLSMPSLPKSMNMVADQEDSILEFRDRRWLTLSLFF